MHESPRTPCQYQLCVLIYACTTSTAFTLAPCWHQIRMHHINSLHFCAFASAFATQRHVVRQERQRKVACPAKAREAYFFSLCFTMRTGGPQKDFSIVSSMTPLNGGNEFQHRSASSSSLQGEKERGDRGPAPRRSAADAAAKKNGDQAKRARALRIRGVIRRSCPAW